MGIDDIEAKVAQFRAENEDVTDDEEARFRDHLTTGRVFIFRCRFDVHPETSVKPQEARR